MRRIVLLGLLGTLLLTGCGGSSVPDPRAVLEPPAAPTPADKGDKAQPPVLVIPPDPDKGKPAEIVLTGVAEPSPRDRYDNAFFDALSLMTERKYAEALVALEAAKGIQDTEQVRNEIARVKGILAERAAAERTTDDIRAVLKEGRADDAARLASGALGQFGGSESADELARLKRQADAVSAASVRDAGERRTRFKAEADAALREQNYRAAAIALEQAVAAGPEDADLTKLLGGVRERLERYDGNRRRAAELRRDPTTLEEAVAALEEAKKAWETLQVRQELEETTLALQKRRDRIAVADFEVRGEVGIPAAGKTLAEELLPAFKSRFDLAERGQVGKVIDELKLEASELVADDAGRQQLGKLAKVRFLVVGSVSRFGGLTVNARLVDISTGLVVQTARVAAPTPDALLPLLPQLAAVLLMTDEQKIAWEQEQAKKVVAVKPAEPAALPPPPEVRPADQPAPPPIVTTTSALPAYGTIKVADFDKLPVFPAEGLPPQPVIVVEKEQPVRERLLAVAVEVGDNHFRSGRYQEAFDQFQLALNLSNGRQEFALRLDRCKPFLPPPPPVVVVPVPVVVVPRPRLVVLPFLVEGDPRVISPGLGPWTADNIAPYFCRNYDVIDRGLVFWYMHRLGLSYSDVAFDPGARRWLARALGARFFLFGSLRDGPLGIDVATHLVDAEYGCQVGSACVGVRNPFELKCRLGELARLTLIDPRERLRQQREYEAALAEQARLEALAAEERLRIAAASTNYNVLVFEAQRQTKLGQFAVALEFAGKAKKLRPTSIEVNVLFESAGGRVRQAEIEAARRAEWERQQAILAEQERRRLELARAAEEARIRAEQEALALAEADRQARLRQQDLAYQQLFTQAQVHFRNNDFALSIQVFQSALNIRRDDECVRNLALARARQDEFVRRREADEAAAHDAALRRQQEAEVARLREQAEADRRRREVEEQAAREAQSTRDREVYTRLLDDAERAQARGNHDTAISSLQTARQLRPTPEVERLLSQALVAQARATAEKKGAREKEELEKRLAAEKARREAAEVEAAKNRELYTRALELAQKALAEKNYDIAESKYQEAGKVYQTDIVLTGLRQAREGRTREKDRIAAEDRKKAAEVKKTADAARLREEGEKAMTANEYARAAKAFAEADRLKPGDVEVLALLTKAEQARDDAIAQGKRAVEKAQQEAAFRKLLDGGKANLKAKQYDAALVSLREAVKLSPGNPEAAAALKEAEQAKAKAATDAVAEAAAKKKQEAYEQAMTRGRLALTMKQYDTALAAFKAAQEAVPGDPTSAGFLRDAQKAKDDAAAAVVAEARKREQEQAKATAVRKALAEGRAALAAKDLDAAGKAFASASASAPDSAEVKKALADLAQAREAARLEAEAKVKRATQVQALVKRGQDAQAGGKYDEAVQAFAEATRLAPDDRATRDLLTKAEKARADAAAAAQKKQDDERLAKVKQLLTVARKGIANKEFDGAGAALEQAGRLAPADADVAKVRQELADARQAASAQDAQLKKRKADYDLAMAAGKDALAKKNHDGAVNSFKEAIRLLPADPEATRQLQAAEKLARDAKAAVEADARKRDEYVKLLAAGKAALQARRYADAVQALADAARLMPAEKEAGQLLQQAKKEQSDAAAAADVENKKKLEEAKRKADFTRLVGQAQAAMAAKKYAEAAQAYGDALKVQPNDPAASRGLKDAQAAINAEAARRAEDAKRKADFDKAMAAGSTAMGAKRYADAVKAFADAAKLQPADGGAARALKDAQAALDASKTPPPPPTPNPRAEYDKQMTAGAAAEKARKFTEAMRAYQAALKQVPGDAKAAASLKNSTFGNHMAEGDRLLKAKKFPDAVKEYEAALKLFPKDADAAAGLKKAKEGK